MALLLTSLAAAPAMGQAWAGRGRAQGTVKDESGKPVAGAKITLRPGGGPVDAKAPGPESMTTDEKGRWSILGLDGGPWGVLIEKEGFMTSEGQISVSEFGPAPPVNVTLKPIPKEVIEQAQQLSAKGRAATAVEPARLALERGNQLMAEARNANGPLVTKCRSQLQPGHVFETECRSQIEAEIDNTKLAQARVAYEEGLAKLDAAAGNPDVADPEVQNTVQGWRAATLGNVASLYNALGDTKKAIAAQEKLVQLKPDDPQALKQLAELLLQDGQDKRAQELIAKLPAGTAVDPNAILNLGIKGFNEGNMDKAFEAFDRAIKENPDRADAYYYRALVYINRNKHAEAKADLQKLLALDPNGKFTDDAKAFLVDVEKALKAKKG